MASRRRRRTHPSGSLIVLLFLSLVVSVSTTILLVINPSLLTGIWNRIPIVPSLIFQVVYRQPSVGYCLDHDCHSLVLEHRNDCGIRLVEFYGERADVPDYVLAAIRRNGMRSAEDKRARSCRYASIAYYGAPWPSIRLQYSTSGATHWAAPACRWDPTPLTPYEWWTLRHDKRAWSSADQRVSASIQWGGLLLNWLSTLAVMYVPLALGRSIRRLLRRTSMSTCPQCNYDLVGLRPEVPCPECGVSARGERPAAEDAKNSTGVAKQDAPPTGAA